MSGAEAIDGIWVFDGVCNFCSISVRLFLALERTAEIRFTPIQSPFGRELAVSTGVDPDQPLSFLFFDRGQALQKSAAVMALLGRLPPPWRWLRLARVVPEAWLDCAYDWFAAHRYRLFGKRRTCVAPSPVIRARFILEAPTS
ncbi:MAG TPA: DCC1-like thiol-disulfide oxidoreductase family protein [Caulobacteraceae bacterium]